MVRSAACSLVLLVCLADAANADVGAFLKPGDDRIYLHGDGNQNERLAGIEAKSVGGHLDLESVEVPGFGPFDLKLPFVAATGVVVEKNPDSIVIGVLGADNRIDVEGAVATSIFYSNEEGPTNDLQVNVGLGETPGICDGNNPTPGRVVSVDFNSDSFLSPKCLSLGKLPQQSTGQELLRHSDAIALFTSGSEVTVTSYSFSGSSVFDIPDFAPVVLNSSPSEASTFDLVMDASQTGHHRTGFTFFGNDAEGNDVVAIVPLSVAGRVISPADLADCNEDGAINAADLMCARRDTLDQILSATGTQLGDLDGDGIVGFDDFLKLSANFGPRIWIGDNLTSYGDGDIDVNGEVEFADFLLFSANFGKSSADAQAVPEAIGFTNAFVAMVAILLLRRRLTRGRSTINT